VLQDFEVLGMEVSFVVSFELLSWFPWVHAFENAKSAEVLKRNLQITDCVASRFILGLLALLASFYFSHSLINLIKTKKK